MVSLFFIIFLTLTVFFATRKRTKKSISADGTEYESADGTEYESYDGTEYESYDDTYDALSVICGFVSFILLMWVVILINRVGTGHIIDSKVSMYEEENAAIEERIEATVKDYMNFETEIYTESKDKYVEKNPIELVSLCPELKSDTFVQQQIDIYIENSNEIKVLKEKKINLSKTKWKLYFGR